MLPIKNNKRVLIYIFLYHLATQGLILFVAGKWFDDWLLVNISKEGLMQFALELGKPEIYLAVMLMQGLPEIFYKLFIFLSYYVVAVCFYYIIRSTLNISEQRAFVCTLIYLAMPVNDARIERLGIPYTTGLFFFSVAFCILVLRYGELTLKIRLTTLGLFFVSFILNSNLVFYGLALLFIVMREKKIGRIAKKADYFILPFVFFIGKTLLFPAHGIFDGYNQVDTRALLTAIKYVFMADGIVCARIALEFGRTIYKYYKWILPGMLFLLLYIKREKRETDFIEKDIRGGEFRRIVLGILAVTAGLFPYVVVQLSPNIAIRSFSGRNSILVPFGLAILIEALLEMCCRKGKIIIVYSVMLLSFFYFNSEYAGYQIDTYWDKGFQENLRMNQNLKTCNTIFVLSESVHRGISDYNGMAEEVYGDTGRLIFDHRDDVDLDTWITKGVQMNETIITWEPMNMTEWKGQNEKIDAIIFYSNNFSRYNALRIRVKEILGADIKEELLENASFKAIYSGDKEFDSHMRQETARYSPPRIMTGVELSQFESIKDMWQYLVTKITNDR